MMTSAVLLNSLQTLYWQLGLFAQLAIDHATNSRSLTDRRVALPDLDTIARTLLLQDYNTRVVVFGTAILGTAAGIVGSFTLLRKRALMGDAVSHASLPGISLAFIFATLLGLPGKSLPILLAGATASGLAGVACILAIRKWTRLKEDAALGIVLSVFFGAGMATLSLAQQLEQGHAAGLESFILGKTASMRAADANLIAITAVLCITVCVLLFKELKLLCFDDEFAGSRGFPVLLLDLALMITVILVTIVGLQAVGLVLMIALLIIPAAAARFWTDSLGKMMLISALIGAVSGWFGATLSAFLPKLPSGSMIVLTSAGCFGFSLVFGTARGILLRSWRRRTLNVNVARQHLLRALFEIAEETGQSASIEQLLRKRSWPRRELQFAVRRAAWNEQATQLGDRVSLTKKGRLEAKRLTREHRLWELYLINYAETALSRVDRQADHIEHVLEPEVVEQLEAMLDQTNVKDVPQSPHQLGETTDKADRGNKAGAPAQPGGSQRVP